MDDDVLPYITLNYPEADDLPGRLLVKGRPYIDAKGGQLTLWPTPSQPLEGDNHLKLDFGDTYNVTYHIKTFHEFECDALTDERVIEASDGIDFGEL